jgi:hypothetical protein
VSNESSKRRENSEKSESREGGESSESSGSGDSGQSSESRESSENSESSEMAAKAVKAVTCQIPNQVIYFYLLLIRSRLGYVLLKGPGQLFIENNTMCIGPSRLAIFKFTPQWPPCPVYHRRQ